MCSIAAMSTAIKQTQYKMDHCVRRTSRRTVTLRRTRVIPVRAGGTGYLEKFNYSIKLKHPAAFLHLIKQGAEVDRER